MKKSKWRSVWTWLLLLAAVTVLFGPAVFAGTVDDVAQAKGQYSWFPEWCE